VEHLMSWKTVVVLLVLIAGFGGFYLYDTYKLTPAREKAEQVKGRLWPTLEPKEVEAVTIKRGQESIRLKRVEGGWEMLEPVKARGDRTTVDDVVTSLATIRIDREIDPNPAKLADFGLEPPAAEVTFDVKGRAEPMRLTVGAKSPTGVWVYGQADGKPSVYALSEIAGRDTSRPVADFRDKTVLAFERADVTGLEIKAGGEAIALEPGEGDQWWVSKPARYKADADVVRDYLDQLARARVKEFVDDQPRSVTAYGLDRPTTLTLWTGRDKDRSAKTLALGRVDTDRKGVYARREGEGPVFLVDDPVSTALPRTLAALRDKTVLSYAYEKVHRIEVESPKGKVVIEKDGPGWKLVEPQGVKADTGEVNGFLWKIRDLRATGFLAEEAAAVPRYLGSPHVTVKIWEEDGKDSRTLLLAPSKEARGGKPAAVAAVAGQGPVMLVDATALDDLSRSADGFRDRTLFPAFELSDVKSAVVMGGDKRVRVERTGETSWSLAEPAKKSVPDAKVTNLLLALKALRWKDLVSPQSDEAPRFGLDKPSLEVTVSKQDGAEIGTLLMGKDEGGLTYVRLKASPAVYSIESRALADVRNAPTDFQ
jgi:hypothetical protein